MSYPVSPGPARPRPRRALPFVLAVAAVVVVLVVAWAAFGRSGSPGAIAPSGAGASTSSLPASAWVPAGKEALAAYYEQTLDWTSCDGGLCAELTVPIDYAKPDGKTIKLALLMVPAKSGHAQADLVVNPGGPGGSGVDFAKAADRIVGPSVRQNDNVVGFDPRGVGRSAPITCVSDAQLDAFLGSDPTPTTPAEQEQFVASSKAFADACAAKNPDLIAHVSTYEVAEDLDVLRAALRQQQLDYLGESYGTFIGSTYAGLFPKRVGRMVLDGVVPPDLTSKELGKGQAVGFDTATRSYLANCVAGGNCLLGGTVDAGMTRIHSFLTSLATHPLPVSGDARVKQLTEGWAVLGIAAAMYTQENWPYLTQAFRLAFNGDGTGLMQLADYYTSRSPNGTYSDNLFQVINAVNCLDRPDTADLTAVRANVAEFTKAAPLWGADLAWGDVICGVWPVHGDHPPAPVSATGSNTIVVVGTTRDPATPYQWAVQLRKELSNAVLLTFDGDGHTAYQRGSSCINNAIDAYLVAGTTPKDGLVCQPDA